MTIARRRLLGAVAAAGLTPVARHASAHASAGRVDPPQPVPSIGVALHTGGRMTLPTVLRGRATALQLMFTGCSATCPIQGALFAEVQRQIGAMGAPHAPWQLVSASIDPLADDAPAMRKWLQQFGAGPRWLGLTPGAEQLQPWLDFLGGRASGTDKHTGQVYFFNRRGELNLRTVEFPKPAEIARALIELATAPSA